MNRSLTLRPFTIFFPGDCLTPFLFRGTYRDCDFMRHSTSNILWSWFLTFRMSYRSSKSFSTQYYNCDKIPKRDFHFQIQMTIWDQLRHPVDHCQTNWNQLSRELIFTSLPWHENDWAGFCQKRSTKRFIQVLPLRALHLDWPPRSVIFYMGLFKKTTLWVLCFKWYFRLQNWRVFLEW